MAVPDINFLTLLTNPSGTGDGSGAQNSPDDSLGGWASTTPVSLSVGNLFKTYSIPELTSSTRYRCVALKMDHATAEVTTPTLFAQYLTGLKSGMTATFGMMTNDTSTVSPVCTDTTAPAGITFFTPHNETGDSTVDQAAGRPLGPLNTDSDGSTYLTQDDSIVIFLYIKIVSSGASGVFTDGVDNRIGIATAGTDSI